MAHQKCGATRNTEQEIQRVRSKATEQNRQIGSRAESRERPAAKRHERYVSPDIIAGQKG